MIGSINCMNTKKNKVGYLFKCQSTLKINLESQRHILPHISPPPPLPLRGVAPRHVPASRGPTPTPHPILLPQRDINLHTVTLCGAG